MRQSKLFGKTVREATKDMVMTSHKLLYQAGFVRESTAGRYFFLPLGWKVHEKIKKIVKEEMDKAGAQEMISPVLHPLELWKETNRTNTVGFELMVIKDQRDAEFALGGTAEEMFVDVVRKFQLSYKDLPFNIYQFSTKFRDEKRARGGLLRVREFVMKDAYSFDKDEESFKKTYTLMAETYKKIFERVCLNAFMVPADNGYIGGEYCDEFQVEHEKGEGKFFVSEDGTYVAHEDIATFKREDKNLSEELKEYQEIDAVRGNTMEDGVKLHGLPLWQQMKDVMFADEKGNLILCVIRGDLDVNETKALHASGAAQLRPATEEEIRAIGSEPGFISPVGLKGKVKIIGDTSLRTVKNMYGGANKKHKDVLNMNIDRDYQLDVEADIAMAQDGFMSPDGKSTLKEKRGIEVGNIFQLGYHYTNLMQNAVFMDEDGKEKKFYMGCYGIGLGRTLATIVEKHNDEKGIIWPKSVTPFHVHLVTIAKSLDDESYTKSNTLYNKLVESGVDVLWDDRLDVSAGGKFNDSDLIGIPLRLVISPKTLEQNGVEVKERSKTEFEIMPEEKLVEFIMSYYK